MFGSTAPLIGRLDPMIRGLCGAENTVVPQNMPLWCYVICVPAAVEIDGLDQHEHGLTSAYSGFAISDVTNMLMDVNENTDLGEDDYEKAAKEQIKAAVKVEGGPVTGQAAAFHAASCGRQFAV